ncbi:longitudinals lacking protein, isoforms N/O/W/X/Y-like [Oppia nitens]|uniref:longitudinals lacking protein, isoforms N/O/W/X/Y-like n=1 Tax=Oppia nitens TaxID=1686743 RepID=UPI0023DCC85D|nr:longitudinals lacking protein, isoforms N/O/W/X/Y-like [Oppia nitens]
MRMSSSSAMRAPTAAASASSPPSSSDVENGYTFRMGDHEITMRDSFASMLDTTQLTDCLLVCHPKGSANDETVDTDNDSTYHNSNGNGGRLTNGHTKSSNGTAAAVGGFDESINEGVATHRVILSASSDYFRAIFAKVPNNTLGVVAVVLSDVDYEDMLSIVDFVYKGQVSVSQSRIHRFLASAQQLMIKGLMNIKLVSNDDHQPIDGHSDVIEQLKNEKRFLENEIRAIRQSERLKAEQIRREIESEMKKKLEIEKTVLNEEKQRFEAERMKFTIEKEHFDKNKIKCLNSSAAAPNSSSSTTTNNHIITFSNSSGNTVIEESSPSSRVINGSSRQSSQQSVSSMEQHQRVITSTGLSPSGGETMSMSPENEGRQLRKRIRLDADNDGQHDSVIKSRPIADTSVQMDVDDVVSIQANNDDEEDDGEIYEVDFSQQFEEQTTGLQRNSGDMDANAAATTTTNNTSTSAQSAIVASTLAYHKMSSTSPHSTRSLRRSTSSVGGESNSEGGDVITTVRRKGPGRTPNWAKEEMMDNRDARNRTLNTMTTTARSPDDVAAVPLVDPNSNLYKCPYCPQVYHANQSMQDHINGIHLNSKTSYKCDFCDKTYTWRISLNKHMKTCHPNEPIYD